MKNHKEELELIANDILNQSIVAKENENKPNYSNRDFMNCVIIFQTALMDKMYDLQEQEELSFEEKIKIQEKAMSNIMLINIM
jgi:hypothetical protein